jgi:hypothetical protein
MRDFALDTDGDIAIVNGDFVLVDGAERVRQQAQIKLKLWTGEWFLDTAFGTPWLDGILGKGVSISAALALLQASLMEIDGVSGIDTIIYAYDEQKRKLNLSIALNSAYGIVKVTT